MASAPPERDEPTTDRRSPRAADTEEVRLATLRRDARRPKAQLLDEAMRLSRFTVELAAAGRRASR